MKKNYILVFLIALIGFTVNAQGAGDKKSKREQKKIRQYEGIVSALMQAKFSIGTENRVTPFGASKFSWGILIVNGDAGEALEFQLERTKDKDTPITELLKISKYRAIQDKENHTVNAYFNTVLQGKPVSISITAGLGRKAIMKIAETNGAINSYEGRIRSKL
ncbi:hypothetical protein FK220_011300 [Flavobacteriaceae bacterium TP-CH-4]|uniref:DUF4251 domain-containing protein n=1 Tax=Pelagihabitans pacificus TaxID=2696054 RepID=A0A967AV35_9FLAO|nr:hypothetical protein [Pelagihabitans pacificus]NHF59930.1 hypothetical protein [Pelagihabitans pacificus]